MGDTIPNPIETIARRIEAAKARYKAAAHAMQTGVAFTMDSNPSETSPKHLRVGVNSAMVEHGALVHLLMQKGIITEVEYLESLADFMEKERDSYVKMLKDRGYDNITLV